MGLILIILVYFSFLKGIEKKINYLSNVDNKESIKKLKEILEAEAFKKSGGEVEDDDEDT